MKRCPKCGSTMALEDAEQQPGRSKRPDVCGSASLVDVKHPSRTRIWFGSETHRLIAMGYRAVLACRASGRVIHRVRKKWMRRIQEKCAGRGGKTIRFIDGLSMAHISERVGG
jgi:hypothetical protein